MKIVYAGRKILGIFSAASPVESGDDLKLIAKGDDLYLATPSSHIKLTPKNDQAKEIVGMFDSDPVFNASLYEAERLGEDEVQVAFFVFPRPPKKLTSPSAGHLYFYFESGLLEKLKVNAGIKDENDLIQRTIQDCVHQDSIFITFNENTSDILTIYGDEYRYQARRERPGLFRVEKSYPELKNIPTSQILQIYKGFSFLTWKESFNVESQSITPLVSPDVPEMIKAWDSYIDYIKFETQEKQKAFGFVPYEDFDADTGYIRLRFADREAFASKLLTEEGIEFQAVPSGLSSPESLAPGSVYLGKIEKLDPDNLCAYFRVKDAADTYGKLIKMGSGKLRYSSFSVEIETKRRKKVVEIMEDNSNLAAIRISRLFAKGFEDPANLLSYKPVTDACLRTMFGQGAGSIQLSETYRNAMNIALNTPDVALIQGPPGTGKTTLICGIMHRINAIDPNARVLLTAEQHDALDNAVIGVKSSMPPIVASKRFESNEEEEARRLEKTVADFGKSLTSRCDALLASSAFDTLRKKTEKAIFSIQKMRKKEFDPAIIAEELPKLRDLLMDIGVLPECQAELVALESATLSKPASHSSDPLLRRIESQRTNLEGWSDDGPKQLQKLLEALKFEDKEELLPEKALLARLSSSPKERDLEDFKDYVRNLMESLYPTVSQLNRKFSPKDALNAIQDKILGHMKSLPKDMDDILSEFRDKLRDPANVIEAVRNYSTIVASTCAQADKFTRLSSISSATANYVIVDEAARVNPLDLLFAMMKGIKVILVGDQKQLPQYLESQVVKRFEENGGTLASNYAGILDKSLFGTLYSNLDEAYMEGRIKARRTIMLDEQHRMNPSIGNFISEEFYDGGIRSAEDTKMKINDFNVFSGKSVAFVDLPVGKGREENGHPSYIRKCEVEEIIALMSQLFTNNPGRTLNIGVLSFYAKQKEKLEKEANDKFSSEQLDEVEFGTVDSFQGKEFDIVLLSCVRSNGADSPRSAVGYLYNEPSRINVALSRAKRLLVLVGDAETISRSEPLKHYVEYVKKEGEYVQR